MLLKSNFISSCFFLICYFILSSACVKKENTNISSSAIKIISLSPQAGKFDINDTIIGKGFGEVIGNIKVYFNNVSAGIVNLNDTQIIVKVPKGAGSGYVSVERGTEQVQGPPFKYIFTVTVSTLAGNGHAGYADGVGTDARFQYPRGVAMDSHQNLYVADFGNNRIRKISPDGMVSTVAGNGIKSYRDGPALDAEFSKLNGIAFDNSDNLYITDATRIRIFSLTINAVSTIAGNENTGNVDGNGTDAEFNLPYGIIADKQSNFFIADAGNNNIRKLTSHAAVTTVAGNSAGGYKDGNGLNALFNLPGGISIDSHDKMYIADAANFRIRGLTPDGEATTIAGNGNFGYVDGRFFNAEFRFPTGITVDKNSNVFVCGEENAIREISTLGDVTTIAGSGVRGYEDGSGDNAMFNQPIYMYMDSKGVLYVADQSNHCIRKINIE